MLRLDAEYVLPLRWSTAQSRRDLPELLGYLAALVGTVDITVVDGSDADVFDRHAAALPCGVRHVAPDPRPGANGKVRGVVTGVRRARHEVVVIADDDVRYRADELRRVVALLADADVLRPQNVFDPLPWHARWDTARTLLNRALGHDHPGTFGLRRSTFLRMGGYDADVLFENLELCRTIAAAGGVERHAPDLFVRRRPPTARHFAGQRVRQAYDSLAEPRRLAVELAILPALVLAAGRRRFGRGLIAVGLTSVLLAEVGRRRAGGRGVFRATAALWAPVWVAERAVCSWIALGRRLTGGMPYAGGRLVTAAHSPRTLRRRLSPMPLTTRAANPGT
jgi:Glycosyl transferase family 21